MFYFLKYIVEFIFNLGKSRKDLLIQITILQKEVEILLRQKKNKRLKLPLGYKPQSKEKVQNNPILVGLCNFYLRRAA
jgi:hypothetical protein